MAHYTVFDPRVVTKEEIRRRNIIFAMCWAGLIGCVITQAVLLETPAAHVHVYDICSDTHNVVSTHDTAIIVGSVTIPVRPNMRVVQSNRVAWIMTLPDTVYDIKAYHYYDTLLYVITSNYTTSAVSIPAFRLLSSTESVVVANHRSLVLSGNTTYSDCHGV
jgi:hypothetical protein